jgi:UDP-N-acetylglucosamine 1-carboxyvinyltransferase
MILYHNIFQISKCALFFSVFGYFVPRQPFQSVFLKRPAGREQGQGVLDTIVNTLSKDAFLSQFIVEGKHRLAGSIRVSGNKNEALPLIAAALLCDGPVKLHNLPDIGDVQSMLTIARHLGASISALRDGSVTITAGKPAGSELPLQLSSRIRGSILFASALLVKTGKAILPQPGGDTIGQRRIDTHFLVFTALGAKLKIKRTSTPEHGDMVTYILDAPKGLIGAAIHLDEASVTATENALIAAVGARGTTTISNAASEPHVQGLCRFLQKAGVEIEGVGSNVLTIHGDARPGPLEHTVGCDYIEAGSLIATAACTGSDLTITHVDPALMRMILFQFERLGVATLPDQSGQLIRVPDKQKLRIRHDLGGAIPKIEDSPWPGMPTDLTSIMVVMATQTRGTCLIHEKMFESRLFFVDKLTAMGAQIVLCDPHRVVVVGPSPLYGATILSPDIRAGMALLIAALAAEGVSTINNIEQIDRGYEKIEARLTAIGAHIRRNVERRKI